MTDQQAENASWSQDAAMITRAHPQGGGIAWSQADDAMKQQWEDAGRDAMNPTPTNPSTKCSTAANERSPMSHSLESVAVSYRTLRNPQVAKRPPRTRGGGPTATTVTTATITSAPHARGWSDASRGHEGVDRVRPARAGVVRGGVDGDRRRAGPPRTRGGGPLAVLSPVLPHVSAPHARGWS